MAVNNFQNRLRSLIERVRNDIDSNTISFESYEYRIDSLMRDALAFRDLPDTLCDSLLASHDIAASAKDSEAASDLSTSYGHYVPLANDTGGRPRFIITKEQLKFFRCKFFPIVLPVPLNHFVTRASACHPIRIVPQFFPIVNAFSSKLHQFGFSLKLFHLTLFPMQVPHLLPPSPMGTKINLQSPPIYRPTC